jgi:hypothetical protein
VAKKLRVQRRMVWQALASAIPVDEMRYSGQLRLPPFRRLSLQRNLTADLEAPRKQRHTAPHRI